jgi:hypothetical protein
MSDENIKMQAELYSVLWGICQGHAFLVNKTTEMPATAVKKSGQKK